MTEWKSTIKTIGLDKSAVKYNREMMMEIIKINREILHLNIDIARTIINPLIFHNSPDISNEEWDKLLK